MRGATIGKSELCADGFISTHTPLAGRDPVHSESRNMAQSFQLTRPLRGATLFCPALTPPAGDFNSHAPCGARHLLAFDVAAATEISTHTPLAGRDVRVTVIAASPSNFNSHAPCGARHVSKLDTPTREIISTHTPLAGRDYSITYCDMACAISTHTPLAGRDEGYIIISGHRRHISTHTPLAGRDHPWDAYSIASYTFQLTRPLRGATSPPMSG